MELDDELEYLREPVLNYLVPLLESALNAAAERHMLAGDRGADNFSFGTDAWSLPARLFKDRSEEGLIPFQVQGPGCELRYGNTTIRHHRVGWSENDDIATRFPGNAKAAVAAAQLKLFDGADYYGPPKDVVLAYMANPQEGLCAVYLARVGIVENGKIVEWSSYVDVWRRNFGAMVALRQSPQAPPERSPDPQVSLVKKRDDKKE